VQTNDQPTPNGGLLGSPDTTAIIVVVFPAPNGDDGNPVSLIATLVKILTFTTAVCAGNAVALAERFTPPCGAVLGAVYTVGCPLTVWVGKKLPQLVPVQLGFQSIPIILGSFVTIAISWACPPAWIVAGGSSWKVTSGTVEGAAVFVTQAESAIRLSAALIKSTIARADANVPALQETLKPFEALITPPRRSHLKFFC
jgi:hypothetical protein